MIGFAVDHILVCVGGITIYDVRWTICLFVDHMWVRVSLSRIRDFFFPVPPRKSYICVRRFICPLTPRKSYIVIRKFS